MGSFVFKWPYPANDVHVTGTFDDWSKSEQLLRVGDHWEKEVDLPSADERVLYKFVVDDEWIVDENAPKIDEGKWNNNNVLLPEQIKRKPKAAATKATADSGDDVPGAFPETPAKEPESFSVNPIPASSGAGNPISIPAGSPIPAQRDITSNTVESAVTTSKEDYEKAGSAEFPGTTDNKEQTFSVNPIPATSGAGNPVSLPAGAPVPAQKDVTSNTIGSAVTTSEEDYEKAGSGEFPGTSADKEQAFSVNPIPASSGIGNPISLPAGAAIPEQKDITPHTVESTVTTSQEDYDKAGSSAFPGAAAVGAAGAGALGGAALASGLSKPEGKENLIPESSLPLGAAPTDTLDAGPFISSSGPGTTTAELASKVPLENNPTISSSGPGTTTADLAASVPLEKKRQGTIIDPSDAPSLVPDVVRESISAAHEQPEAAASPEAVEEKAALEKELLSKTKTVESKGEPASAATLQSSYYGLATSVPETVEKSMQEAHAAPEAAADASIVAEKSQMERELIQVQPTTDAAGEPAPTIGAAQSDTAPAPTEPTSAAAAATALTDGKTANEPVPDTDTSTTAHGASAGEIAGGAAVGGAAAAGVAALSTRHESADVEPPRVADSQKPDITTETSPATVTAAKGTTPGQHPSAAAAIADGAVGTPTTEFPQSTAHAEATDTATTEYAPLRAGGAVPGVSSAAAAALSDGTEDPTLSEEPAVQMMKNNEDTAGATSPTAATTESAAKATNGSAAVASGAGSGLTPAAGIPSLTEAGTGKSAEKTAEKTGQGSSAAGASKPQTPSTPSKKTEKTAVPSSPASTSATDKKKKHRIRKFIKKILHQKDKE